MSSFSRKLGFLKLLIPLILALIFFSFTGKSFRRAPWYEQALWDVLAPPQKLFSSIGLSVTEVWRHYFDLINVSKENDELVAKIDGLESQVVGMGELEAENTRLKSLLAYKESTPLKTQVARVISNDPKAEFKSITIDLGSADGVMPLMPVIGPAGLVGKVGKTAWQSSRVILITDPNSAVDAIVQRSRARGVLEGAAWRTELKEGYYLTRLEYLRSVSDIQDGDVVVTSGLDGIFPPGLPIGSVHDLRLSRYGVFREANVVPFVNLAELQEVMVVFTNQQTVSEGGE